MEPCTLQTLDGWAFLTLLSFFAAMFLNVVCCVLKGVEYIENIKASRLVQLHRGRL